MIATFFRNAVRTRSKVSRISQETKTNENENQEMVLPNNLSFNPALDSLQQNSTNGLNNSFQSLNQSVR